MGPQPRQPKGVPVGGQFDHKRHDESALMLKDPPPLDRKVLAERHAQLATYEGYVPAVSTRAFTADAATAGRRKEWWDNHFVQAEYTEKAVGQVAQMPDDFTPSMTPGASTSGHRRTHRMRYTGAGVEMRMPSAASIRRYDKENSGSFDVPVAADYPGGTIQGWVRVTRNGDNWHASGLGFPKDANVQISEAVSSVLEARRVTTALSHAGDLADKHRARIASQGVEMKPVRSSWVKGVAYDENSGTMMMQTADGRSYGHRIDEATYEAVAHAKSPGAAYNKLVKGKGGGTVVERCEDCGRFTAGDHQCPGAHQRPEPGVAYNQNARARAEAVAATASAASAAPVAPPKPAPAPAPPPPPPPTPPAPPVTPDPPAATVPPPVSGRHTVNPDEKTIDLKGVLREGGKNPSYGMIGEKPLYGHRGWTLDAAAALQPFTSETHSPYSYARKRVDDGSGQDHYSNGDMGLVKYHGAGAEAATELLKRVPPRAQGDRLDEGPILRNVLEAARDNPGRIEFAGSIIGPDRTDERISTDTVYSYDSTEDPEAAWAATEKLIGGGVSRPGVMRRTETPWRPGEQAWQFEWD